MKLQKQKNQYVQCSIQDECKNSDVNVNSIQPESSKLKLQQRNEETFPKKHIQSKF